ncbi:MAG: 4-hydroxythreonine-4-phosphate dehydrogenase [Flavobacteriales bacterium]|jgi:4-hydroxythreonine-4-phosphate dehydrogenase
MENRENLKVGISIGDMNGISPEVIVKTFQDKRMFDHVTPVVYGHVDIIKKTKADLGFSEFQYSAIKDAADCVKKKFNIINVWSETIEMKPGELSAEAGHCAYLALKAAVEDLASNKIDVLVTGPINKDLIQSEDFKFPGHTEFLADMANVEDHLMLLVADELRVGVVTGHVALKDVSAELTKEKIMSKIQILHDSLQKDFGINHPKIAVLGLNPHAGDNGLLGDEEKDVIIPAIKASEEKNMYVYGPFGADGFFGSSSYKSFDGILAMYHDQGLVPFKALAFDTGVNFTAGLPIVRTSPDHGTAYDLAGKGEASAHSIRQAIFVAVDIYERRRSHKEMTSNPLQVRARSKE